MNNLLNATVTVKGVRPLFWHKFGPESLALEKQEKTGVAGNDPEEWRKTVMATTEGQLYLEPTYIFGCLRDAARYTKKGRQTLQTPLTATLQCTDDIILVDRWLPGFPNGHECNVKTLPPPSTDPNQPVYLDIRGVRNPTTKARNVRYRVAASPGWTCTFHLLWDKTIVSRNELEAVLNDAGKLCGLGNGRNIGMGRFEVTEFTVNDG